MLEGRDGVWSGFLKPSTHLEEFACPGATPWPRDSSIEMLHLTTQPPASTQPSASASVMGTCYSDQKAPRPTTMSPSSSTEHCCRHAATIMAGIASRVRG